MKRVGVLRGGNGKNYGTSLRKGGEIISFISKNLGEKYKTVDILLDREGVWHVNGVPIIPGDLSHKVDLVWNTAHPASSATLSNFSIPETGTKFFSVALENNRDLLREHIRRIDIHLPRHVALPEVRLISREAMDIFATRKAKEIHEKFAGPWIVKSYTTDQPMSVEIARTFPELISIITTAVSNNKNIMVEELIMGKIASLHTLSDFRGEDLYAFPLGNSFGSFSQEEKERLINLAKSLHRELGADHYLKSDFVLGPRGRVYLLNLDSVPDLRPESQFHQVCASVGAKAHSVIEHILNIAS